MRYIFGFLLLFSVHFVHADSVKPPQTVSFVDLNQYLGRWYEIAKVPNRFQKKCASDTTADYSLKENGRIQVINSCLEKDGGKEVANGEAKVDDTESNAKLKVSFFKVFGKYVYAFAGDYWIIELDTNYRWVVVGHPKLKYGWILSRHPALSADLSKELAGRLERQGYNPCDFEMTQQTASPQSLSICQED